MKSLRPKSECDVQACCLLLILSSADLVPIDFKKRDFRIEPTKLMHNARLQRGRVRHSATDENCASRPPLQRVVRQFGLHLERSKGSLEPHIRSTTIRVATTRP